MNRNEQQMYRDISSLTKALEKLVKVLTKSAGGIPTFILVMRCLLLVFLIA